MAVTAVTPIARHHEIHRFRGAIERPRTRSSVCRGSAVARQRWVAAGGVERVLGVAVCSISPKETVLAIDHKADGIGRAETGSRLADLESLRAGIARLTPEQQKVIFLRFFQHLPHDAVAKTLSDQPQAIRWIQLRALAQLRQFMEAPNA